MTANERMRGDAQIDFPIFTSGGYDVGVDFSGGPRGIASYLCTCGHRSADAAAMLEHMKTHASKLKAPRGAAEAPGYAFDCLDDPRR